MFKLIVLLACVCACVVNATPVDSTTERVVIPILSSEINKQNNGAYDLHYEGGDGTSRKEEATVINEGTDDEALEVKGSYKYINSEGQEVEVFYTAGVNGFVPYGESINPEISAVAEAAKDLPKDLLDEKEKV